MLSSNKVRVRPPRTSRAPNTGAAFSGRLKASLALFHPGFANGELSRPAPVRAALRWTATRISRSHGEQARTTSSLVHGLLGRRRIPITICR